MSQSTKRKRKADPPLNLVFKLSSPLNGPVGPTIVSYPALQAPDDTPFKTYTRKKSKTHDIVDKPNTAQLLLVGETNSLEFVSNEDESRKVEGSGCRYLLAVHDRRTNAIRILPTPKTPHILKTTVKALKSIAPAPAPSHLQYQEARTALGETFGTKKAKLALKTAERNLVNVGAMEGVMDYVMEGIDQGAKGLLTKEQAILFANDNRLIPTFDAITNDPALVYPLHSMIPEAEWTALSVSSFEGTFKDKIAMFPFRHSSWINEHFKRLTDKNENDRKRKLKILLYISTMFAFRQAISHPNVEKHILYEKFKHVPRIVVDGLLSKFTECARGSTKLQATSATSTNLLTHAFALCLKLDNFASDTTVISHDLSMKITEVNQLFKSLGCKLVKLGERERGRLMLTEKEALNKRAVLTAPVQFPNVKLGQRLKRR